jgi:hypothetical protein
MWFLMTETGTFCVRYMREGYGLFLGEEMLSWHKDAETAAAKVSTGSTGFAPWDEQTEIARPKDLSEWQTVEDLKINESFTRDFDPVIITLDCSCGNQLKESIRRIRTLSAFRCPQCKATIRIDHDRFREIMETTKKNHPDGYVKGLTPR